ncbi:hypothetical protein Ddc_24382 [Ditylenchus destructor]|nr:hypothetical protein Ddc_24382 [Ditylenchus destructor]
MEHLVREGVAYARSVHGATETSHRINLDAFLDSLVFDYQDMHKQVSLTGKSAVVFDTRPHLAPGAGESGGQCIEVCRQCRTGSGLDGGRGIVDQGIGSWPRNCRRRTGSGHAAILPRRKFTQPRHRWHRTGLGDCTTTGSRDRRLAALSNRPQGGVVPRYAWGFKPQRPVLPVRDTDVQITDTSTPP